MRRPRRTRHNITDPNSLRFPALVADPAAPRLHLEDLAILVGMPIGARARQERHVVAHDAVYGAGHFVHVDVAGEGVCGLGGAGAAAGLGGVADDGARHVLGGVPLSLIEKYNVCVRVNSPDLFLVKGEK